MADLNWEARRSDTHITIATFMFKSDAENFLKASHDGLSVFDKANLKFTMKIMHGTFYDMDNNYKWQERKEFWGC